MLTTPIRLVGVLLLGSLLAAPATAQPVGQADQAGQAGQIEAPVGLVPDVQANHRGSSTGGQDVFLGGDRGRLIDLGTVFNNEQIVLSFTSFNALTGSFNDCRVIAWLAIKAANNRTQLQQVTLRFIGSLAQRIVNVARTGDAMLLVQLQRITDLCFVAVGSTVRER